jgi:hypothetical protein
MPNDMQSSQTKPRLIYFQNSYDNGLPEFLLTHKQEHVDCLSVFFDVTVIKHDCDYQEICDTFQPDIALFESGVNLLTCRRPKIANVRASSSIPRVGLLNADAWCETRSGSLSEMDHWGIETIFSISVTAPEHIPEIADRLFVWPNFIDPTVYRDYNEPKLIPVLLSGATAAQYPWRRRVYKLMAAQYPSLVCPHRGYLARSSFGQVLHGERYARTLNASQIAPVCGTVAREVVRKHFEIPACNTCLITERTRHIEEAGFVDMENCIFADESSILDKLEHLFKEPDQLRKITAAGHRLVHSQHTSLQRDQILQWFTLQNTLKPNEKIVQPSPFVPLKVAGRNVHRDSLPVCELGMHLQLVHQGDEQLGSGQVQAAESKYLRSLSYMHKLPEARFKLALCKLYAGHPSDASSRLFELIQYCISEYRALDPDPVEWAYYIISLICLGKMKDAEDCADEFPWLRHPELDRVRRIVQLLKSGQQAVALPAVNRGRVSIHQLPVRSELEWRNEIFAMLRACGQDSILQSLVAAGCDPESTETEELTEALVAHSVDMDVPSVRWARTMADRLQILSWPGVLERKLVRHRIERKLRGIKAGIVASFQHAGRHMLKNKQTDLTSTVLLSAIRDAARDLHIKSALIVGGGFAKSAGTAALEGTLGSDLNAQVYCIDDCNTSALDFNGPTSPWGLLKRFELAKSSPTQKMSAAIESIIEEIRRENNFDSFDLIVLAWPEIAPLLGRSRALSHEINTSRLVILGNPNGEVRGETYADLFESSDHVLLDQNTAGDCFVISRKLPHVQLHTKSASALAPSLGFTD